MKSLPLLFTFVGGVAILGGSMSSYAANSSSGYVSLGVRTPHLAITVDDNGVDEKATNPHEIVFEPAIPTIGTVAVSYRHLSLGYSNNLDGENESDLSYTDYRLGLYYSWFGVDASYTEFLHFMITESSGFGETLSEKENERLHMAARFASANIYLIPLRWNYQLDQALSPEESKTNGLGLGIVLSYNNTGIDTRKGLVPTTWQTAFGRDGQFKSGQLETVNAQLALTGSLSLYPFFLNGLIALGQGQQKFEYITNNETRTGDGMALKANVKASAGYSAKSTFFAVEFAMEAPTYILRNMSIEAQSSDISATFGVKF